MGAESGWAVVGLVSATGEAEVAAGLGVQGLLPCRRAPVCCTSWCAPKRAATASAPHSQSRRPYSDASRSARCGRAPARPLTPAPSVPVLDSSGPHPQANPLGFCQRGSPESLPFPGVLSAGFPRRDAAPGSAADAHPGPPRRPLHNFLLGSETPGPAGSATSGLQPSGGGRRRGQRLVWEGLRQGRGCRGAPGRYRFKCT